MKKVVKKPYIELTYNTKNVTRILSRYIISLRYTDYLKGQADELEITLKNPNNLFNGDWYPQKGDKLSAKIGYEGSKLLNCGIFTVDEPEFSGGTDGEIVTIRSLSASINKKIREKNSKTYVNKTLVQIAQEIAERHAFKVVGKEGFLKIPHICQYDESDLCFLNRISSEHGYIFKLTDDILTFTKLEAIDNAKALTIVNKSDIQSYNFRDTSTKTYTACRVQYYNPKTGKYRSVTVRGSKKDVKPEILKLNKKCRTKEQAIARANAGLSQGQTTVEGNINFKKGNTYIFSGANFNLKGFARLDNKYQVKQATHEITKNDYLTMAQV